MASFIIRRWSRALSIFLAVACFAVISFIVSPTVPHHVTKLSEYLSSTKTSIPSSTPSDRSTKSSFPIIHKPTDTQSPVETSTTPPGLSRTQEMSGDPSSQWTFNHAEDSNNYGLTPEQCDSSFPDLFTEINRAAAYQKNDAPITYNDLDISWKKDGAVRAMIFDQQLYILETKPDSGDRALSILHAIHRALIASPFPIPNIEFSFSDSDIADRTHFQHIIWTLSRREDELEKWVMSDFGFWSWPLDLIGSYEQVRSEIGEVEKEIEGGFKGKKKKVVWRGTLKTNKHREELVNFTKGKEWADVQEVRWSGGQIKKGDPIQMADHCRYQFVLQTEGRSYSGRGKYLQNCNSVVIIPKRTWIEPHHSLLIPSGHSQNFVEIKDDFSDLEVKISELLKDQDKAERIANNGVKVFRDRNLTPAAQACYWRKMFVAWRGVLGFEPKLWEGGEEGKERMMRGVPFETYAIKSLQPAACTWLKKIFLFC